MAYNNRSADRRTAGRKIISPNIDEMADTGIKLLHYCALLKLAATALLAAFYHVFLKCILLDLARVLICAVP